MTATIETSPHGAATVTTVNGSEPSLEDLQVVNRIRQLYATARELRRPKVARWNRSYNVLRNRTWLGNSAWYPQTEVPEILPIIESLVGWLTDQRPSFDCVPSVPQGSPYYDWLAGLADDLRVTMNVNWQRRAHETTLELVVRDAYVHGAGIVKTVWDNTLEAGLGDATFERVDPYAFFPDPAATAETDANYFLEVRRVSLQTLDRRFPGAASKLAYAEETAAEIDTRPDEDTGRETPKANPAAISPGASGAFGLPGQSRLRLNDDTTGVVVIEAWIREHRTEGQGADKVIRDEWRCIVIAGRHVLLNEKATDLWSHGLHPYNRFVTQETGEFWGLSMVELLTPAQRMINRLLAAAQNNIELTGNPVLLELSNSGIGRNKITNKPGQRISVNPSSSAGAQGAAQWMTPPPIRSDLPMFIQFYIGEMERISGLTAINRGMAPGGRNAASVVESLQEASFVRVRMASRNLERTLREIGTKLASNIAEFYTVPRTVAIAGPTGERTARILAMKHFYVPTADPRAETDPTVARALPFSFQLLVQAGSMLPTSRQARASEGQTLHALGVIDDLALLEALDWPNRQLVYQRVQAAKAAGLIGQPGQRQAARA